MAKKKNGQHYNHIEKKRLSRLKNRLKILRHISKKNCALLPFLNDESLHTLGEFIFNVINQKISLDEKQIKKVRAVLKKDRNFYKKLIDVDTSNPLSYFRKSLQRKPQIGKGVVSLQLWLHLLHQFFQCRFCIDLLPIFLDFQIP